jgi:hypothetical protein
MNGLLSALSALPPSVGQIVVCGNSMIANAVPAKSMGAFGNTQCYIMRQFLESLICEFSEMHGLAVLPGKRISRLRRSGKPWSVQKGA